MSTAMWALVGVVVLGMLLRMPIGFSMMMSGVAYLLVKGQDVGLVAEQISNGLYNSYVLLAVPLFVFAANIMNAGTVSERIFDFCRILVELENSIMGGLNELDPDLMLKIQDNMFTFENLISVDNKGIQVLMRAVEPDMLMIALKGASDGCQARFFDNMSERARGMFRDDMEAKGPQRMSDVENAQKQIMRMARKLSDSGELMLGGADFV